MNDIFYRKIKAPLTVRGFTVKDANGDYNVYINDSLSEEAEKKTLNHELQHIKNGDFEKELEAHEIEALYE